MYVYIYIYIYTIIHPVKYLYESLLPCDSFSDNSILLISTLLILIHTSCL